MESYPNMAEIATGPYSDEELEQIELHDIPAGCGCQVCRLMATIKRDRERLKESDELLQEAYSIIKINTINSSAILNKMESC